jgi:hypothetical protein
MRSAEWLGVKVRDYPVGKWVPPVVRSEDDPRGDEPRRRARPEEVGRPASR